MAASGPKPGILRERHFRFQIGDTPRRSETLVTHGLQQFDPQFNRTAVDAATKISVQKSAQEAHSMGLPDETMTRENNNKL
jgi:hypothetical protein